MKSWSFVMWSGGGRGGAGESIYLVVKRYAKKGEIKANAMPRKRKLAVPARLPFVLLNGPRSKQ